MRQDFLWATWVILLTCFLFALYPASVAAEERTVGLLLNESTAFEGYTLFSPMSNIITYLINNEGLMVHSWQNDAQPSLSVYLLESGILFRTATIGRVQEYEWDGTLIWDCDDYPRHHDVQGLLNDNVLIICREEKSYSEAIAAGRDPNLLPDDKLYADYIIEVEPDGATGGNIVWEWHVWDHLIQDYDPTKDNYGAVFAHPELIDLNFDPIEFNPGAAEWNHTNSVDYNEQFDQIILSIHRFSEIWVIDHSTTTEEAASHSGGNSGKGGDLLYRWGNPQAYRGGTVNDQKFFRQHDAQWIEAGCPGEGNILVFNNGDGRPEGNYSSVDEIVPPVDSIGNYTSPTAGFSYEPEEQIWIYTADNPTDFYSGKISGAQRFPNGNTLICNGSNGIFFEVTSGSDIVWKYINPITDAGPMTQGDPVYDITRNNVFKIRRYAPDYPGLAGHDLTPISPIEIYANPYVDSLVVSVDGGNIVLNWFGYGATYHIYGSSEPFAPGDLLDTVPYTTWTDEETATRPSPYFYYVTAVE